MSALPDGDFESLLTYLRESRGFDFTAYKRSTLRRRVMRRLQHLKIDTLAGYIEHLEVHPDEFHLLFDTFLINVTEFFRDPEAWDFLAREALPQMLANKAPDDPVRVWSAGCASGEEACTAAMILARSSPSPVGTRSASQRSCGMLYTQAWSTRLLVR